MLTAENFAANLRTAQRVIRERQGLPADAGTWTFEQRQQFNQALAQYIAQYPGSFAPNVVEIARRRLQENPATVLLDTSLDFSAGLDVGLNAGAESLATAARWGLIAAVLFGIVWIFVNRPPRGPSAARA